LTVARWPASLALALLAITASGCELFWSWDGVGSAAARDAGDADVQDATDAAVQEAGDAAVRDAGDAAIATSTPRVVQVSATNFVSGSSQTLAFNAAVARGDAIIVFGSYDSIARLAVTDAQNDPFAVVVGPADGQIDNKGIRAMVAAATNVSGGAASVTLTLNGPPASTVFEVYAIECSGVSAFDVGSFGLGTSTQQDGVSSGTLTTTGENELLIGLVSGDTVTPGTGLHSLSLLDKNVLEDRAVGAPGAYQLTATATNGGWIAVAAALKGF
jgi:hypothetical protein